MRLSCSALPEERPPMLRNFPIQLRPNVRIKVAELRPGKAGGQIQLAKPPAGVVLFSVGILLRNRQGKHGSIRQNRAGPPAGSRVKSLATQNKLHKKILLSPAYIQGNRSCERTFPQLFFIASHILLTHDKIHRTAGSVKRGYLRRQDKNSTSEYRPAIDALQTGILALPPQFRNDSIQFSAFFHENGKFSRFPADFDGFSTAKFVFQ